MQKVRRDVTWQKALYNMDTNLVGNIRKSFFTSTTVILSKLASLVSTTVSLL